MEELNTIIEREPYDVIVIGAGAAGMMAAGTAARSGKRVLLIEKMEKSGRKVRISGKGRCNVTNARPAEEFLNHVRVNREFLTQAFSEFNNRATIRFFERQGVKLDIERGERVFPRSGKAWDIANALLEYCVENGVKILYETRVTGILTLGGRVYGVRYRNKRGFERKRRAQRIAVRVFRLDDADALLVFDKFAEFFVHWVYYNMHQINSLIAELIRLLPESLFVHGYHTSEDSQ